MTENEEETNDLDSILNGEDVFKVDNSDKTTPTNIEKPKEQVKVEIQQNSENSDGIPNLRRGDNFPPEYLKMVDRIRFQYSLLPTLDYNAIHKELGELSIKSSPTPTLQVLNDELYRVQAAKDRLSEILMNVIKCYNIKNRAVDILKDSWGKFTAEKNTEGRKGDAAFRLSDFTIDFAEVEALMKACNHVLKNLDGIQDRLSRTITIFQQLLKLRDIGRGAMPDFDFDKTAEGKSDMFGELSSEDDLTTNSQKGGNILREF